MIPLLIVLLVILLLFGGGFALELLWYIAIALFVLWVLGFLFHAADRRWYHW
ncbi:DUF5670 family protein [Streptomyces sp. NPDC051909]|uniref:DUF5670 family protein n=1 Tax=Streptomyces sp. NPDC051909 TaxID=3154944 RepID=UPI00343025DA